MQTEPNFNGVQAGQYHTLVYMGAGSCSELDALLALQPQRLLLIEADPQLAAVLQARTSTLKQIQVQNTAVSGHPGPATFYRYNLPHAGSLHPASGLLELFPGLKIVEQLQMESESPATLLQPLQIVAEQDNRLIIDLPGEELPVLQALQQAGQLHLFSQLQLHGGRQPLYEGSKPAAQILQWLHGQGFDVLTEDDTQDPDRPCWTLQRNTLHLHNRELEQQLQLAQQASVEQDKLAAEAIAKIEQLSEARDEQATLAIELHLLIQQLTQERDEQAKWHLENKKCAESLSAEKAQLEQQLSQLTYARDEQSKLVTERQTQVQQLTQARDEQTKLADERYLLIQQLTQERDGQTRQLSERQTQLDQLNKEKAEQGKLAAERQSQIEQLTKARDEQVKLAAERQRQLDERQKKLQQIETQNAEFASRQSLLQEEIVRAEAQIDLIKDVLLREPGL